MFGPTLPILAIAALAMFSVGGIVYALLYGRISSEARVGKRLSDIQARTPATAAAAKARASADPARRRKNVQDTLKEMEERQKSKARNGVNPPLSLRLQQAGLGWSKQTFVIISVVFGVVTLAVSFLLLHLSPIISLAFGIAGALGVPRWYVGFRRKRRFKKFFEEFPNAVDVIVRGVKAGLPLNDCIRIIANEAGEPVKSEFRHITEAQGLGLGLADAVLRLPERVPLPESSFFAIVISIQQTAGGNLSEALGNLSKVLRERKKMKGKIGAMSMEAKASAAIIGALPIIVMVLVFISSPQYIMLLFTERLGHLILGASALWMLLGVIVMRRMINFDY